MWKSGGTPWKARIFSVVENVEKKTAFHSADGSIFFPQTLLHNAQKNVEKFFR